ncbi:MAG: sulfite exporter TauE/SafE family protein [Chloroflexi bacterium]|nr:MAG: sulfite exporter TauE/SafE family protein [Chloroflexota bacterium]
MNLKPHTIIVLAIILLSTFVRSTFGFGDALIAMPLLAMTVGIQIATPLVALIASTIAITILLKNWRSVDVGSAWRLVVSSLIGIPIGLVFLKGAYENIVTAVLALLIVSFSLYSLLKPKLSFPPSDRSAYVFGLLAGILGGAYNTNGPPIVIYGTLKKWPAKSFRATLQGYFSPTGLLIVGSHGLAGLWTSDVLHLYFISLPVVFLAILLGGKLNSSIPTGKFDRYIHVALIIIGTILLINSIHI